MFLWHFKKCFFHIFKTKHFKTYFLSAFIMQNLSKEELILQIKNLQEELQKLKKQKKYGIVWEEKEENIDKDFLPILEEKQELRIEETENKPYNLIIEWDNFHSLSILQNTHKNKIDVIYIDPPYNTGNKDFIYNDNYVDKEDTYRHSKWLSFMNKRLKLAKNLLKDDWVIFISIDDNEFAQLKLLCDEIFGEKNFVGSFIRRTINSWKQDSQTVSTYHEYCLCYTRNIEKLQLNRRKKSEEERNKLYPLEDEFLNSRWRFYISQLDKWSIQYSDSLNYPIIAPDGSEIWAGKWFEDKTRVFRWWKEKVKWWIENNYIVFKKQKEWWKVYAKSYEFRDNNDNPVEPSNPYTTLDYISKDFSNFNATPELQKIFNWKKYFDFPKPVFFIKDILMYASKPNSTILDFFAWSGTTWHAVLELNKEDWWERQFILCNYAEDKDFSENENICQSITYERNKRVMQGYTNPKWEKIEGLWGNLRYYKTGFIPKNKSIDDLRYSFINKCDDVLCIKENTFTKMNFWREIAELKIFKNKNHYTVILYDIFYFEETIHILKELSENKISLYIFSVSKEMFQEELQDFAKNITFENIPDEIMETYEKIFNF